MRRHRIRTRSQDTALQAAFWTLCALAFVGVVGGWAYLIHTIRAAVGAG